MNRSCVSNKYCYEWELSTIDDHSLISYSLKAVRAKVWNQKTASPLFNVKTYTQNLERVYRRMWEAHVSGKPVSHLVEPFPPMHNGTDSGQNNLTSS